MPIKIFINIFKPILASLYLILSITIAVHLFMDIDYWGEVIVKKFDLKVSQKFLGGEIVKERKYENYSVKIHKPVFNNVFEESKIGFIQIDWFSNMTLPALISEFVDYNNDGISDFKLALNTKLNTVTLTSYTDKAIHLMDKTSLTHFALISSKNGNNCVFNYTNHKAAIFLGYTTNDLLTLSKVYNIIDTRHHQVFTNYINNILHKIPMDDIEITMVHKLNSKIYTVQVSYLKKEKYLGKKKRKIKFQVIDNKENQKMTILVNAKGDVNKDFFAFPQTVYKNGRTVRVILKK